MFLFPLLVLLSLLMCSSSEKLNLDQAYNRGNKTDSGNVTTYRPITVLWDDDATPGADIAAIPGPLFTVLFDLGQVYDVDRIRLFGDVNDDARCNTFQVTGGETLASRSVVVQSQTCAANQWFDTSLSRRLRYVELTVCACNVVADRSACRTGANSCNSGLGVTEFEIYGQLATTTTRPTTTSTTTTTTTTTRATTTTMRVTTVPTTTPTTTTTTRTSTTATGTTFSSPPNSQIEEQQPTSPSTLPSVIDAVSTSNSNVLVDVSTGSSDLGSTTSAPAQPIVGLDSNALYGIIAVGCCICLMLFAILIVLLMRRRRKEQRAHSQAHASQLETMNSASSTRSGFSTPTSGPPSHHEYASAAALHGAPPPAPESVNYGGFDTNNPYDHTGDRQINYAHGPGSVIYDAAFAAPPIEYSSLSAAPPVAARGNYDMAPSQATIQSNYVDLS
jgi:hypothetical protein